MIKTIVTLKNDLSAKAGQALVIYEDGSVHSADAQALDAFIKGGAASVREPASDDSALANRDKLLSEIKGYLLGGFNVSETAIFTNAPKKLVSFYRAELVLAGLLSGKQNKGSTPIKHHWFKTKEALESARSRGRKVGLSRRGKTKAITA